MSKRKRKTDSAAAKKRTPSAKSKPAKPKTWQEERREQGIPEAFIRFEQYVRDSGSTVVDAEPPTDMDRFEVNFVPRRATTPSPPPTESRSGSDDADADDEGATPRGGR